MMDVIEQYKDKFVNAVSGKVTKGTADVCEWLTIVVLHAATIPTLLAFMAGITDRTPPVDIVLFIWVALLLLFVRSNILRNTLNTVTIGVGFIMQAILMALTFFG